MDEREIHPFGEVLSQQSIGVLVGTPLPGMLRIAEVHLHIGGQREALVIGHLFASIPGQRLIELTR